MTVILQVALDLINSHRAIEIAKDSIKGGADWIEAGTPLIKSEGMAVIRQLREQFPHTHIVADLKTMDTGAVETEMAAKAGADIICILGVSDDATIQESVKSGKKYGAAIMVDLIGVTDVVTRAKQLEKFGVDYLCIHVGIDAQMKGETPLEILKDLNQQISLPLAVAGGITSESAVDFVNAGAAILIVGGAITKAKNVTSATAHVKKAITEKKKVRSDGFKKFDQSHLHDAFLMVSTANISDAMHKQGALQGIASIVPGCRFAGQAVTVQTIDGDWAKPVEAIDIAQKNQVLVIAVQGGPTAVWGELATWSAKYKGLAGVVIDGTVRDIDAIRKIGFPVFCRHTAPNAGEPKGLGEIGAEVTCGSQTVHMNDWIIGDDSGVVVVPKDSAQEIANRAVDVKEHEDRIREEIKQGGSLGSVLKLHKWEKKIG